MRKAFRILLFLLVAQVAYAQTPVRIACGQDKPYTDASGNTWAADSGYNIGSPGINWPRTFSTTHLIAGAPDPTIFQHERWSLNDNPALVYTILVPSGAWTLNLYFSENYYTAVGQRIFNVKVNGYPFLTNFDIFAMAGAQFTANVQSAILISTGTVTIEFDHLSPAVDNPKINAIELLPITTGESVLS